MFDFTFEIEQLRRGEVTSEIINKILEKFGVRQRKMIELYERYKASAKGVPIFQRVLADASKVNNLINNDYFSEIIDTKTGYFAGKPISYSYSKKAEGFKTAQETISRFNTRNNIADLDAETSKMAAVCGYGARLLYIDKEANERAMNLMPFEAVILTRTSITESEYALRVYSVETEAGTVRKVEFYDETNIHFYVESGNTFVRDAAEEMNPRPHLMKHCPVIGFPNNDELLGDVEKVLALIDGYDRTMSDINSEIEAFRLAYMAFKGGTITEDALQEAMRMGAFNVPDTGEISFITKDINDAFIEHHLDRIHNNIYRFSKTPDLADEAFSGNSSGVALKFKLFGLESKCTMFERKMQSALQRQFDCLTAPWLAKRIKVDPLEIIYEFKRNFPQNLLDEADTSSKLKGLVSEQTRLGLLSFVDDADYESDLMMKERDSIEPLEPDGGGGGGGQ